MTKNSWVKILITALILAAFSVAVFVIPLPRTRKVWFAYGFGVFAILFRVYAIVATNGKEDTKKRFYGFPVTRLANIYLVLQLAVSVGGLLAGATGWTILVISVLILPFPILGFITTRTLQAEIARQEKKKQEAS